MTTAREIITKALQKNGVLTGTETPSADMANDGLDALNALLSSWSNESMLIYAGTRSTHNLVAGVSSYTIGTGQTFNTSRPIFINSAYVTQAGTDYPLTRITDEAYNAIPHKMDGGTPEFFTYSNEFPTATIRFYRVPNVTSTVTLLSEKALSQFTLDDDVSLPPGWERALIFNTAIETNPDYGQPLSETVIEIARQSKASIKTASIRNKTMDADSNFSGRRNIYTGWNQ